jgi:hypothetical protein
MLYDTYIDRKQRHGDTEMNKVQTAFKISETVKVIHSAAWFGKSGTIVSFQFVSGEYLYDVRIDGGIVQFFETELSR